MGYVYAAMWLIAGLILIFRLSKENKIFYVAGGFFLVLGVWWLLDSLFPDWKVFQGTPGAVLKVLTFIVLGACLLLTSASKLTGKKRRFIPCVTRLEQS